MPFFCNFDYSSDVRFAGYKSQATSTVRKAHSTESLFNLFSPPVASSEEAIEAGWIGEEELDKLEEIDYQIG